MANELGAARLRLEREGPIAWCVIDRPEARNALTPPMYFGIKRAVHAVNPIPGAPRSSSPGRETSSPLVVIWGAASTPTTSRRQTSSTTSCRSSLYRDSRAPVVGGRQRHLPGGWTVDRHGCRTSAWASDRATFRVPELLHDMPPTQRPRRCCRPMWASPSAGPAALGPSVRCRRGAAHRADCACCAPHEQLREAALAEVARSS